MPKKLKGEQYKYTSNMDKNVYAALKELSDNSRVPLARYLEEGAEMVLEKYNVQIKK